MANEITVAALLSFAKGVLSDTMQKTATTFDMTGVPYERRTMSVPTTAGGTALPLGDVTTPGYCFIRNTDPTNYITVKPAAAGVDTIKIKAGEFAVFRFAAAAPAVLANTAACVIEYLLLQD